MFTLACISSCVQGDILEVGSWCGRSSTALGMAARLSGNSKVHCVDLWPAKEDWYKNEDGSYSFTVTVGDKVYKAYREQTVRAEPFLRDLYPMYERFKGTLDAFNSYATKNGLGDYIVTPRCDLTAFAENAPKGLRLRMAFIDGEHTYEAVCRDIETIERFLVSGGWICLDDAFSSWDGASKKRRLNAWHNEGFIRRMQYA